MMPYILQAGLMLAACLAFYKILLRKETFFRLNRLVLISCLLLSFSLPLVQVPAQWSFRKTATPALSPAVDAQAYSNQPTTTQVPLFPVTPVQPEVKKQTVSFSQ